MRKWLNRAVQPRREARQHDRRLAAARGADQCRQTLPADRLRQSCDRRIAAKKQICVLRPEISEPRIGARSDRSGRGVGGGRLLGRPVVDREILDVDGAGASNPLDLTTGDGCLDGAVRHREYGPTRRLPFGRSTEVHRADMHALGPRDALHDAAAHVELDPRHRLLADAVRLHLLDQLV